jgi:hypothetical protein
VLGITSLRSVAKPQPLLEGQSRRTSVSSRISTVPDEVALKILRCQFQRRGIKTLALCGSLRHAILLY